MPGYCFCFSNSHRFTVFASVKTLNCFAICSILTEAFSLCILLKEEKSKGRYLLYFHFLCVVNKNKFEGLQLEDRHLNEFK